MNYKLVYVCSPLRGEIKNNIEAARLYCKHIRKNHPEILPVAPHLYFSSFMDDTIESDRMAGMEGGNLLLKSCSELWYFSPHTVVSEGMEKEIKIAKKLGLKIKHYNPDVVVTTEGTLSVKVGEGVYET